MGILSELNQLLTWWNGQTFGTRVFTARKGQKVGGDEQGNQFYQTADGKRTVSPRPAGSRQIGMAGCITLSTTRLQRPPCRARAGRKTTSRT
jgi:hypothetical protein